MVKHKRSERLRKNLGGPGGREPFVKRTEKEHRTTGGCGTMDTRRPGNFEEGVIKETERTGTEESYTNPGD